MIKHILLPLEQNFDQKLLTSLCSSVLDRCLTLKMGTGNEF